MRLTPDQQDKLRQTRATEQRRVSLDFTTEQKQEWQQAVAEEVASKDENIAHFHKLQSAAEQPGFLGDIRRAILMSQRSPAELSAEIGVDSHLLSDFRSGEAELPATALSRLIEVLGLRLMQEIPH